MKLKNIRVRLKDLHHGKIVYVAHPLFGIDKVQIVGKPYTKALALGIHTSLFIHTIPLDYDWWKQGKTDERSLCDMGVYKAYGYRRTFHTRKQAEQYVKRFKLECTAKERWSRHSDCLFD